MVKEALKVVERKLFYFLEDRHVQGVLFRVFVVGQECSTNSIVFVDCTLLNDLVLLRSYFVDNRNMLLGNSKVEMIFIALYPLILLYPFLLLFVLIFL